MHSQHGTLRLILFTFDPNFSCMFFLFSKILNFLIHPLTWIFVLLLYALFTSNQIRKRRSLVILVLSLYVFSNSFLADEIMRAWEIPAVRSDNIGTYDAGIVLSGMMSYDMKLKKYQFMSAADRLLQALELYKKGKIRKIVFTGGSGSLTYSYIKEGILIRNFLLRMGIPPQDKPHLFTAFYRAANAVNVSGTGLGLAIVKQMVERHGGHITFESEFGSGATFTVSLPKNPLPEQINHADGAGR